MDNARLLRTLSIVEAARPHFAPLWDPHDRRGFLFRGSGSATDDDHLRTDLEALYAGDYLERVFIERLSYCPSCDSHAINVHEGCLSCGSSHLTQFRALFHFRCGFVGPVSAFKEERKGLRCPKCNRLLADLGTDHDSPGNYFRCLSCVSMFQLPEMGARCLSCGARFRSNEVGQIAHRDVFGYRLSSLGRAALREGRIFEELAEILRADYELMPRHRVIEFVDDLRERVATNFALIRVDLPEHNSQDAIARLKTACGSTSKKVTLGRLDARHLVAVLEAASQRDARSLCERLSRDGVRASVLDVGASEAIDDALQLASRDLQ